MEQNSDAWTEWRKQGIGASDAPVIMGVSPWKTPYELWEEKTGRATKPVNEWITRKGNNLEPVARAHFEFMHGFEMHPLLAQHYQCPILRASMDGFNRERNVGLEIKFSGKADFAGAIDGRIPDKYFPQLQHQLIVSGAEFIYYWSFDGKEGTAVRVLPDETYIQMYLWRALEFWRFVETDTPPPMTNRDWTLVRNRELRMLLDSWEHESLFNAVNSEHILTEIFNHPKIKGRRARNGIYRIDGINRTIRVEE